MDAIQSLLSVRCQGVCPHDSCLLSILRGARNGLYYGAKVRFPHALVMTFLFRRNAPLMSNVKAIWDATSTHSINLGSYVFVFKTLLCLMRHLRGADGPINVLVAGALAGYRIFGKNNAINSQINMYILSRVLLGGVNALVKHNVVPAFDQAYPIYAGTCWALVMYLFYYHRGNMQKSIDTSMEYLYIASEHRPSKAAPTASAALVGGSASTLLSERGFGGVLYAVMEWCLQDL